MSMNYLKSSNSSVSATRKNTKKKTRKNLSVLVTRKSRSYSGYDFILDCAIAVCDQILYQISKDAYYIDFQIVGESDKTCGEERNMCRTAVVVSIVTDILRTKINNIEEPAIRDMIAKKIKEKRTIFFTVEDDINKDTIKNFDMSVIVMALSDGYRFVTQSTDTMVKYLSTKGIETKTQFINIDPAPVHNNFMYPFTPRT